LLSYPAVSVRATALRKDFLLTYKKRRRSSQSGTKAMLDRGRRLGDGTALAKWATKKIEEIQKEIQYETQAIIWRNAHFIRLTGWMYRSSGPHPL
jgi:hypothetical protein